jgi:hypothetical protein
VFAGVGIAVVAGADGAGARAVAGSFLSGGSVAQQYEEVLEALLLLDSVVDVWRV